MNLSDFLSITIPEGEVESITVNGVVVWSSSSTEPTYTNQLAIAQAMDSTNKYNDCGYRNGYYLTSSSPFEANGNASEWVTGFIPYTVDESIYIKGVSFTTASHDRIYFFTDKSTRVAPAINSGTTNLGTYFTVEQLGTDYWKLTPISGSGLSNTTQYVRMSFTTGTPSNVIITIDEPIEEFPSAYQRVEYIQTDGNQAIDTGIKPSDYSDGLEYVFKGCLTSKSSKSYDYLFGCLADSKRSANVAHCYGGMRILIGTTEAYKISSVTLDNDFTLYARGTSNDVTNFTATFNDTSFEYLGYSDNTDMPSANIYLLACNINGNISSSTSSPFTGKLYSFTMSDINDKMLRNFVPCYRKSDNVIGLYDTVGGQFYTNIGTGSFTKGANV